MAVRQDGELELWMLDTRTLWPGDRISDAATEALALISAKEQVEVKRKLFIKDARMSLASALLKRLYISKTLSIPWDQVVIARWGNSQHGKPAAQLSDGAFADIDFNVSHQGGLVTLVGWAPKNPAEKRSGIVSVGTDITMVNERDDLKTVDQDGIDGWVDMFAEIFGEGERWDMTFNVDYITLLDGTHLSGDDIGRADRILRRGERVQLEKHGFDSELIVESKLRRFYTFFAYKEAYIKLAGEALLAPWLRDLEFQNVRSPKPGVAPKCSTLGVWGERVEDVEVTMKGKLVENVQMDVRAFEENYLIASAIQGKTTVNLGQVQYTKLDLESDIMDYARKH